MLNSKEGQYCLRIGLNWQSTSKHSPTERLCNLTCYKGLVSPLFNRRTVNVTPEEKISGVSFHQVNEVTKNAFDTVWFCGFMVSGLKW